MNDDLVLYTHPMSRGRIARWMLEEIGCPYRAVIVDYGPAMKAPSYLAINPMGKVPAITHAKATVTECAAICAYLAETFPEAGLAPTRPERAAYYRWLFFAAGPLESAVSNKALGMVVPQDKQGMVGYGSLDQVVSTLDGELAKRPYIAGDRFTAADVYVGAHIGWGMQFGTLPRLPTFEAYDGRLQSRPAASRAKSLDDALVPAHPMPKS